MKYTIYAIYNKKHNKIYIGQTKDLKVRIKLHNSGEFKNSFTSRFDGLWTIIYKEDVINRTIAIKREKQLKSFRGREFIKKIIPR